MSTTTYVHQEALLCTKLNQVDSQQGWLKIVLKEQWKGLSQVITDFHL